jgi:hypothetical protein
MLSKTKSNNLSEILRYIADRLESDPALIDKIHIDIRLDEKKKPAKRIKITEYGNDEELYKTLKSKNIATLKSFIRDNRLGRDSSIAKLKTKSELLDYIKKRLEERNHKGDSFIDRK